MSTVGIIANPASGKDIRRLVAHGSVFDNNEKVNIVRRVVLGLVAAGVQHILFMPDYFTIGAKALHPLKVPVETEFLPMEITGTQYDSTRAARIMAENGAQCLVTLGGDGTNRAVAKGSGDIPLMPISTGTNNVFPVMVEGTIAGLAAGLLATGQVAKENATIRTKRLEIYRNDKLVDLALIDAVVTKDLFIASRALWDMERVCDIVLTCSAPDNIGMSSIGGLLIPIAVGEEAGAHVTIGHGGIEVFAPIAPGMVTKVPISQYRRLLPGENVTVDCPPCTIALDGEREIEVGVHDQMGIRLSLAGPVVLDHRRCMAFAARQGLLSNR